MERSPEAPQHSTTLRETFEQITIGYQKQNSNDKSAAIIAPKQTGQKPMPESGSRLLNDLQQVFHKIGRARLLNDSQPASESIYTEPEAVQTEKAAQTISLAQPTEAEMLEAATAEFFKLALANTVYAEPTQVPQPQSLSGAAHPAVPPAASPMGSPTPVSSPGAGAPVPAAATTAGAGPTAANPSNIKGLHQIMQQFMPGATAGGPGRPLPGLGGQGGPSVGQGSSSATGGKAAPLPGVPGHVATNVIDQRGALDPTGRTVDGNNSSTVQKFAALIQQRKSAEPDRFQRFAEICRSAVNKNQTKTASAYGYCPQCGAPGESRERRLNGNDKCQNGHTYPSSKATSSPIEKSASAEKQAFGSPGMAAGMSAAAKVPGTPYPKGPLPFVPPNSPKSMAGAFANRREALFNNIFSKASPPKSPNAALSLSPAPAVPDFTKTRIPAGQRMTGQMADIDVSRLPNMPTLTPPDDSLIHDSLRSRISPYYGHQLGNALEDARGWMDKREHGTALDAFPKWDTGVAFGMRGSGGVDRQTMMQFLEKQKLPANMGKDRPFSKLLGLPAIVQQLPDDVHDQLQMKSHAADMEHQLTRQLMKPDTRAMQQAYNTPFSAVYPQAAGKNQQLLARTTTPAALDPRLAGLKRVYTMLTGDQVNTPEAADRALQFAANPDLSAFDANIQPPRTPANSSPSAKDGLRQLFGQPTEYDDQVQRYQDARKYEYVPRPPAEQIQERIEPETLDFINNTPALRDTAIRRMLELVNRQQAGPQKQAGTEKQAFGSPGMYAGMKSLAEAARAPTIGVPAAAKAPAPVVPKFSPAALPQGKLTDVGNFNLPKGLPVTAWNRTAPGAATTHSLGDNIQRYYGGRPGLDKAIGDAQDWQARRVPGTALDAFSKWKPEAVDRQVPTTYAAPRDMPGPLTRGAYTNNGNAPGPGDRIVISTAMRDTSQSNADLEHELTHALTAVPGADIPFSRVYPAAATDESDAAKIQKSLTGRSWLDYTTTPTELDPRIAAIKRVYTGLTGEDVNSVENADKALRFASQPKLQAFDANIKQPVPPAAVSVDDALKKLFGQPTNYQKQLEQYKQMQQNHQIPRPEEEQMREHIDQKTLDFINNTPEVRDTVLRRMLELVKRQQAGAPQA